MKPRFNWLVWAGFGVALLGAFTYIPIFAQFPATRDIPWVNLLLFAIAICLLGTGVYRAFARPSAHRGKISGVIFSILTLAMVGLFSYGVFYEARKMPSPETALRVGQRAPDFTLADVNGRPVALAQLLQENRAVLLIFYRGYW